MKKLINEKNDFSNSLINKDVIKYIIDYCFKNYQNLNQLVKDDEERNERLQYNLRRYSYKKHYSSCCEVTIKYNDERRIVLDNLEQIKDVIFNNINRLRIVLDLSYRCTSDEGEEIDRLNRFIFNFEPSNIYFTREANYSEPNIEEINNSFKQLFSQIPSYETIFSKE